MIIKLIVNKQKQALSPDKLIVKEEKPKGLGDSVAAIAEPIKQAIRRHSPPSMQKWLDDCQCAKRRAFLNKLVPYSQ